jgi:multidrug efflux system membrane fusion protein
MTAGAAEAGGPSGPSGRRGRKWIAAVVVLIAAALAGALFLRLRPRGGAGAASSGDVSSEGGTGTARGDERPRGGRGAGGGADRVVPVLVARVESRDVPIYLQGLGTVTAYKTVNVRTQVDGRLERVVFTEGQAVRRGQLLAQVDSRPFTIQLHQAEAALARDQAQLHGAERNLERYVTVSEQRLIPQQQVDDQRALTEQLRATVKSDQAQIETARLQLAYARITSPTDGVTGIRLVDPGNVVHASDPNGIVVVAQMDPIAVLFTLPQDDLPKVAPRQAERPLPVDALSREGDQLLAKGALALIDNQINQNTATIRLKAIFPNPDRTLWPNQFVKARLRLAVRKGALVVPAAAVQRGPQGAFVYVVGSGDRAAVRPVVVDLIEGEQALLSRGVTMGEQVVVEGQNQLRPNARVTVREPGNDKGNASGAGAGRPGSGSRRGSKPKP